MPNKSGRKNGRRSRRQRRPAGTAPETITSISAPRVIPEIAQVVKNLRWVRYKLAKPATGDWILTAAGICTVAIGACTPASHLYLHKLRIWSETDSLTTETSSFMIIDVVAAPGYTALTANTASVRYTTMPTVGSRQACIAVHMPEFWRIYPLTLSQPNVVAVIRTTPQFAGANAFVYVDALVNTVQRGVDPATLYLHREQESTLSDLSPFESLSIQEN